jgi:hypothetical protein
MLTRFKATVHGDQVGMGLTVQLLIGLKEVVDIGLKGSELQEHVRYSPEFACSFVRHELDPVEKVGVWFQPDKGM